MEVPVPQVAEQFVARFVVTSLTPYEQISERICERMVEVTVPQVAEQLIGVTKSVDIHQERFDERTGEPEGNEQIIQEVKVIPSELPLERMVEQIGGSILQETGKDRERNRASEQGVDIPVALHTRAAHQEDGSVLWQWREAKSEWHVGVVTLAED